MKGIEVRQVTKTFDHHLVLNGIGLTLEPNKIYGLLGRNGAGKSTLLNLLVNRIRPDEGEIKLDNELIGDNDQQLGKLFLMSEVDLYPKNIRVKDIFKWSANFYGSFDSELAHSLSKQFSLKESMLFHHLSTGYRTITKLIVALSVPAEYVFLDEPVLGLDANHRELFYNALVESYAEKPRTFVIATHLIEEFAKLIEHVMVMDQGRIVVDDETETVLANAYTVSGPVQAVDQYTAGLNVIGSDRLARIKANYVYGPLNDRSIPDEINIDPMDLQTLFINLTNGGETHE
ncbi:ATP-binding cassette domain-containing protein [Pediococcus acidilactici]|uniref:ATP-binding cassette domain-containing protein n=1 Tax=Pediococcus acidilactici TaxID=1254 RepID=UPI000E5D82F3|nr:ABC transporter ATP-binding protein [Pediococcus acidilactici]KAF0366434.1 ATP-binding cassette domain-containing protein [Pediococcus acidilactici]RJF52755.1 ABC transporter ATP-binding protein [Pediococcus acidilactici]